MQSNQAWIATLSRIPADLHDALALGLTTGAEIVVQKIMRLEADFMIIRGRLAGTQDTGRIVLVPYAQLTFAAIQKYLNDADVASIFGNGESPEFTAKPAATDTPAAEGKDDTLDEPPQPVNTIKRSGASNKMALLAKLRDRLKDSATKK